MNALYAEALASGAPGFVALADHCVNAGGKPGVTKLEAFTAAALFARLGALRDAADRRTGHGHNVSGEVLVMREALARQQEDDAAAIVAGAASLRAFGMAADLGSEAAEARLANVAASFLPEALELARYWEGEGASEQQGYDATLLRAAAGEFAALNTVVAEALQGIEQGHISRTEGLVIAEQALRLGVAADHAKLATRLTGILLLRAHDDHERGDERLAHGRAAEAVSVAAIMAERGEPLAVENLPRLIRTAPIAAINEAATRVPFLLTALNPKGMC